MSDDKVKFCVSGVRERERKGEGGERERSYAYGTVVSWSVRGALRRAHLTSNGA